MEQKPHSRKCLVNINYEGGLKSLLSRIELMLVRKFNDSILIGRLLLAYAANSICLRWLDQL